MRIVGLLIDSKFWVPTQAAGNKDGETIAFCLNTMKHMLLYSYVS